MNKLQAAEQLRKALQMFAMTLAEEQAMEIPCVYDSWAVGKQYKTNEYFKFGMNEVGDPQLYKVVQDHTSQEDWLPDATHSLYIPIGLDNSGHPIWARPTGAHDSYNIGDIVNYNDTLYKSLVNGNTYSPEEYPAGWEVYAE